MPLFWAKQYGGIGDDDAKNFVENVYTAVFIGDAAFYGESAQGIGAETVC